MAEHANRGICAGLFTVANRRRGGETSARSWALRRMAWMLVAGFWALLPSILPWVLGRLLPTVIFVMMVVELGAFIGTQSENKYGKDTLEVKYR